MEKFEDCVPVPDIALDELTGGELKLLVIMIHQWANMADETGWYSRSVRDLCQDADMSNKTIQKYLKSMIEKEYLSVRKDEKYGTNSYQLHHRFWEFA